MTADWLRFPWADVAGGLSSRALRLKRDKLRVDPIDNEGVHGFISTPLIALERSL
jgi:hypothetical protein